MNKVWWQKFLRSGFLFIAAAALVFSPSATLALSDALLDQYAENNILYYDPDDDCNSTARSVSDSSTINVSGGGYERLKEAVRQYYQCAMEAQKLYGTPWEVVFAQMQKESQVGLAGHAVDGADNNYLGITGEGDAGYYLSALSHNQSVTNNTLSPPTTRYPNGRKWAKYSSVCASISDWAGPRVARSSYYVSAFTHLSLDNYDLVGFVHDFVYTYAPPSENDSETYVSQVLGLINGPIREVREELGLPSSEEYARENSIDAAKMSGFSAGDTSSTSSTASLSSYCSGSSTLNDSAVIVDNYAFPLLGATQKNYLNPGGVAGDSSLSRIPCGANNICHHDYAAVDMGLRKSMVDGSEYKASDFNAGYTDMYYYSMGVKVVAFTSGTITSYKPYSRAVGGYENQCASVVFKGDDGYEYWFGHMSYDNSYKAGDHLNVGDIIGEIGPPQCAIGTQAHFHINIQDPKYDRKVIDIIDKLWESLPKE